MRCAASWQRNLMPELQHVQRAKSAAHNAKKYLNQVQGSTAAASASGYISQ